MSAFRKGQGKILQIYVPQKAGFCQRSTGTTSKVLANQMERMVEALRGDREWTILASVRDGLRTLGQVYDAYVLGAEGLDQLRADLAAVTVTEHLDAWVEWVVSNGQREATAATYRLQVETFVTPTMLASELTPAAVTTWLGSLTKRSPGTKRKYLYALASLVRYLRVMGLLSANPLDGVVRPAKGKPRDRWVPLDTELVILGALAEPYKSLVALIYATGGEVSAVLAMKRRDLDLGGLTVHIPGTKTAKRRRTVELEPWAVPYLEGHCRTILPNALLFPGISRYMVDWHHKAACDAVKVEDLRVHDARRSLGVRWRLAGRSFEEIGEQLGNSAWQVSESYSQYKPSQLKAAEVAK